MVNCNASDNENNDDIDDNLIVINGRDDLDDDNDDNDDRSGIDNKDESIDSNNAHDDAMLVLSGIRIMCIDLKRLWLTNCKPCSKVIMGACCLNESVKWQDLM